MVGDRYRLDDRIAAGGMGEVWQATDTVLGRDVAVKTLHTDRARDPEFQTRFRHEARAMAVLHHPNVADVFDYGESGSDAYIVMARVEGQPLNQRIAERGRLTAAETLSIIVQAGRALEAAHQAGIVHRDVKPGNLIIEPDDTVVLVDFGVARSAESATLTGAKEVVGTALYIAPEQVSKQVTGPAADIYALGAVAYHCLAGHPPFLGDNPVAVAMSHLDDDPPPLPDDVPEPVQALVATAMAKDPAKRFPSAGAMADAAAGIDGGTDGAAAVVTTRSPDDTRAAAGAAVRPASADGDATVRVPARPPTQRRRGALLAGVLGLLTVAAVAAVLAFVNPAGLLPGGPNPSTAVPGSADPGGAPASPGAGATGDGSGNDGGNTTRSDASPAGTVRPTQPAGAPATSATPTRNTTPSRRPSATTTRPTSTAPPAETTAATTRQTTSAPDRETTTAATAATAASGGS
jgi:serine/threonine-protein kinase